MINQITVYWAAPCFTQAERIWNRLCAEYLSKRGFNVILPQDEAEYFSTDGKMNFDSLAYHCMAQAIESDVMIAILDGPDSDSGTSMECGLRIGAAEPITIGVRTDFRKSEDGQLNAMFRLLDKTIYCFDESYGKLCDLIAQVINERMAIL